VNGELERQTRGLELIASENFVPRAVMEAQGSVLTNKYAEGYPGKKYYGGCEYVSRIERVAIERAKALFGAEHANVQPHSGSSANIAIYLAALEPGQTILSMSLDHGGHLSHGHFLSQTGKTYGVSRETETIDYDQVAELALEHRPALIIAGASAYPRIIDFARFRAIADRVGAKLLVDMAHIAGLVAGRVHPNPVPYADFVTTTTHKTLRGPRGALILCRSEYAAAVDRAVFPGIQGGPLVHAIAGKAVCLALAGTEEFGRYAARVVENARVLAEALEGRNYRIVSGGTDNHLMLVDLRPKEITGRDAEKALEALDITVNKNLIPFDPERPTVTSGIRLGTPALTTRGMGVSEMRTVAELIDLGITGREDPTALAAVRSGVARLSEAFPLYPDYPRG
jgi:glycine hydroxymethyltransferase